MSDFRVLFLWYMVEGALVGYVGMGLIGIRLNLKQFITVGILQGLVVWGIRGIYTINEIPFGTHVFFNLLGLVLILYFFVSRNMGVATLGGLLGFIIIILSESLMLPSVYEFLKTTQEKVWSDVLVHITMGYTGDWLLILVAMVLFISKKSLIRLDDLM